MSDINDKCLKKILNAALEGQLFMNGQSTVRRRMSGAQRQVPAQAWVAPSICLPHCCVQTVTKTKTKSAINYPITHLPFIINNYIHHASFHHGRLRRNHRYHPYPGTSHTGRWRRSNHNQTTEQHQAKGRHHFLDHYVRGGLVQGITQHLAPGSRAKDMPRMMSETLC